METRYKATDAEILFWSMKQQSDNSVVEKSGVVGKLQYNKIHKFSTDNEASRFYLREAGRKLLEYTHHPYTDQIQLCIPITVAEEDLVNHQLNLHSSIEHVLEDTGNGQIGDGSILENHYSVLIYPVNKELALKSISDVLKLLGISYYNIVS
jgi:hypothetical protein